MSVLVAVRHNAQMKAFYERLKKNGKHTTAAQIAVMKKLILLAFSLYKNDERYDPQKYLQHRGKQKKKRHDSYREKSMVLFQKNLKF